MQKATTKQEVYDKSNIMTFIIKRCRGEKKGEKKKKQMNSEKI